MKPLLPLVGVCFVLSACSQPPPPATTSSAALAHAATPEPQAGHAHALVIQAASCWLGGFWSDALGETGTARDAGIRLRCNDVVRASGESPSGAYYATRALDDSNVEAIAQEVWRLASYYEGEQAQAGALVRFLHAIADVSRETMHARNAADKVKEIFVSYSPDDERVNKINAAPQLHEAAALRVLLGWDGPYAAEAHVIALFHALDRVEIARGLPKHLKIYALADVNRELFGVAAPELAANAAGPIPTGTWLAYLSRVADAAGHPVPADARNPQYREPLAWNAVLVGYADKLRTASVAPPLDIVTHNVVKRIDDQAAAARSAFEAHPPSDR